MPIYASPTTRFVTACAQGFRQYVEKSSVKEVKITMLEPIETAPMAVGRREITLSPEAAAHITTMLDRPSTTRAFETRPLPVLDASCLR